MRIVGVLLAAGRGARFGGDKLLAPLRVAAVGIPAGTPIGMASCRHLVAALPETIAVVRPRDAELALALAAENARVIECARADEGMGASLACAIAASADADGWVVALADMPWIRTDTIARIADALRGGADIAAPFHAGRRGHPVGFARRHADALRAQAGDEGARAILAANRGSIEAVAVDDAGILRDVDVPGDV